MSPMECKVTENASLKLFHKLHKKRIGIWFILKEGIEIIFTSLGFPYVFRSQFTKMRTTSSIFEPHLPSCTNSIGKSHAQVCLTSLYISVYGSIILSVCITENILDIHYYYLRNEETFQALGYGLLLIFSDVEWSFDLSFS
ncbi:hypothetical protein VIGAN_08227200 [Vigna angularis var. angularis]|uniref:Uncharacterized protein n=1 Tax=Vigna angularis var. angularis TaxID=157739 RepID=A0A0S3SRR8_PHAAN|nr:hypothetical protein VIGAN_08227200 [Vigna angularis var. angularis]